MRAIREQSIINQVDIKGKTMRTIQIDTEDKKAKQNFIKIPFNIYESIPQWTPPLEGDILKS